MADAKKCDRCGMYYPDEYRYGYKILLPNEDELDLCDKCYEQLVTFINNQEEDSTNEKNQTNA